MHHAAIGALVDVHRVGIAEQVVHVAKDFLIGADQEDAQHIVLTLANLVYRQAGLDRLLVDILTDLAVGVAGQVLQHGAAQRLFVQT